MTPSQAAQEKPTSPRTEAERDLCDVLYHSEFHISREQADISGRLMYDAMLARGYRIEREAAAATPSLDRNLLAEAIFESGVRQTMSQSEQAADNILAEIPIILARLDEGSATPEQGKGEPR